MTTGISIVRRQPYKEEMDKLLALLEAIEVEFKRTPNPWFGRAPLGRLQLLLMDRVRSIFKDATSS